MHVEVHHVRNNGVTGGIHVEVVRIHVDPRASLARSTVEHVDTCRQHVAMRYESLVAVLARHDKGVGYTRAQGA